MTLKNDNINDLVAFVTGDLDAAKKEAVLLWIKSSEENRRYYDEMREVWLSLTIGDASKKYDAQKAYKKFSQWVDQREAEKRNKVVTMLNKYWKYAAVFIVAIVSSWMVWETTSLKTAYNNEMVISAGKGQIATFTFPDGTKVVLNADSRLAFDNRYGVKDRYVTLEGEAFFDVHSDKKLPFIVNTSYVDVEVLGTKFNVSSYANEDRIVTTLLEGSVELADIKKKNYLLKPNEMAVYSKKWGSMNIVSVAGETSTLWIDGKYKFKNATLKYLAGVIERMYAVKVVFKDKDLQNEKYTGSMDKHESVEQIFEIMKLTSEFKLEYKKEGDRIYLSYKK
ncbi:FecR family protein [Puteibacter caeruleilacunae]|nr:FecR family protein [Puteibacter caeruleilacunae]